MEQVHTEQCGLPVYDAERIDEYQAGGILVLRGLTEALREQLVTKSREPAILKWTPRDAAERFTDVDAVKAREIDIHNYPLVRRCGDGSLDLAGLLWLSPRPNHGANFTYAVRLYEGYGKQGLAERLTNAAIRDFGRLHPEETSLWLDTDNNNEAARRLYEKTGWQSIIRGDEREIMTKLLDAKQPKIVVIGGGTGSFTVLSGLKHYTENTTAIVNMADDGGSSGRLRDEYGILPPGDVNQCLTALSENPELREMLGMRFKEENNRPVSEGELQGHSGGNLLMLLLQQDGKDFEEALQYLSRGLAVKGRVVPVTTMDARLRARREDGEVIHGEYQIGKLNFGSERPEIWLEPEASITDSAKSAIADADIVVIAPGNLYGSLAPALVVRGMREALATTQAKRVYVSNLVTKPGQTEGFKVHDFADEIERFIGAKVLDYVIFNTDEPTPSMLSDYTHDGEYVLEFDLDTMASQHYQAIGLPLIAKDPVHQKLGDKISSDRTLIRHDSDLLAKEVIKLLSR